MGDSPMYTAAQRRKPDLAGLSGRELDWVHPSESNGAGGMCVELAEVPGGVVLRDSANPGRMLAFSDAEIDVFLRAVSVGEFDRFRVLSGDRSA
jgi:hypothetical protein